MSDIDGLRRTQLAVSINNVDLSENINAHLLSATFTDVEDGASDDLELKLEDRDNAIVGTWLNTEINKRGISTKVSKNATISMKITQKNWDSDGKDIMLNCGTFELDEVSVSGPPQVVTMRGAACSFDSGIRKKKYTKSWKNTTLLNIAQTIAAACGYTVMYLPQKTIKYTSKIQQNTTYIVFLQNLCNTAGLSLKVTNGTLVIFDQQSKESAASVRTIKRGDGSYSSFSFQTSLSNTAYSACHVSYKTTAGKKIEYTYTPPGSKYNKDTVLEVSNEKVSTTAEAKQVAIAKLRAANKGEVSGSFTMPGDLTLCAGLTVSASGWGAYDGKYIIEQAKHTISKSGGFKTALTLRQVITGY